MTRAQSNQKRMAELLSGSTPVSATAVASAVNEFFTRRATLAPTTIASYRNGSDAFLQWTSVAGVVTTEAITAKNLMDFRAWWAVRPAQAPASGPNVGRGQRVHTTKTRSPLTINRGLRVVRSMLNEWRIIGATPKLTSDLIRDTIRFEKRHKALPHFLRLDEIRTLVDAALAHDAAKFTLTRAEHSGSVEAGCTPRYAPITPVVLMALLTGCRFGELAAMRWSAVSPESREIVLSHTETKTRQGRRIDLTPTPLLAHMLASIKQFKVGDFCLGMYAPLRRDIAEAARKRLIKKFQAPKFTWHDLRRTSGTLLTCAPGIYGGASAFLSAKRLGHSVAVAEAHYVGAVTNLDKTASTLEAVMGLSAEQFEQAAARWREYSREHRGGLG